MWPLLLGNLSVNKHQIELEVGGGGEGGEGSSERWDGMEKRKEDSLFLSLSDTYFPIQKISKVHHPDRSTENRPH